MGAPASSISETTTGRQLLMEEYDPALVPEVVLVRQGDKVHFFRGGPTNLNESIGDNVQIVESVDDLIMEERMVGDRTVKTVKDGKWIVEGPYQRSDTKNANQRFYSRRIWERLVADEGSSVQQCLKARAMLGHLEHPSDGRGNLKEGALLTTSLKLLPDGVVWGRSELLDNPNGLILQEYCAKNIRWGVSSRGAGSVGSDGQVSEKDYTLSSFDAVSAPSTPGAYPVPVQEQDVNESGSIVDKPMAAKGLTSYRYRYRDQSHIAIGAHDHADAKREAMRSFSPAEHKFDWSKLDKWDGSKYVPVQEQEESEHMSTTDKGLDEVIGTPSPVPIYPAAWHHREGGKLKFANPRMAEPRGEDPDQVSYSHRTKHGVYQIGPRSALSHKHPLFYRANTAPLASQAKIGEFDDPTDASVHAVKHDRAQHESVDEARRSEYHRIAPGGGGGFLNPPGHPEHEFHVEGHRGNGVSTSYMSLSHAAAQGPHAIQPTAAGRASGMLKRWEREKKPLSHPNVKDWVHQVHGYFKGMYRKPDWHAGATAGDTGWHAGNLNHEPETDPIKNADRHAGTNHIRKFYPEYQPTADDHKNAYWGTKTVKEEIDAGDTPAITLNEGTMATDPTVAREYINECKALMDAPVEEAERSEFAKNILNLMAQGDDLLASGSLPPSVRNDVSGWLRKKLAEAVGVDGVDELDESDRNMLSGWMPDTHSKSYRRGDYELLASSDDRTHWIVRHKGEHLGGPGHAYRGVGAALKAANHHADTKRVLPADESTNDMQVDELDESVVDEDVFAELAQHLHRNHGVNKNGVLCTNYSKIPGLKLHASSTNGTSGIGQFKGRTVYWSGGESGFKVEPHTRHESVVDEAESAPSTDKWLQGTTYGADKAGLTGLHHRTSHGGYHIWHSRGKLHLDYSRGPAGGSSAHWENLGDYDHEIDAATAAQAHNARVLSKHESADDGEILLLTEKFHTTRAAAKAWLNAGNFVPALKAQHEIVPAKMHKASGEIETGYTVVLHAKGKRSRVAETTESIDTRSAAFRRVVTQLQAKVQERDQTITSLQEQLNDINAQVAGLSEQLADASTRLSDIREQRDQALTLAESLKGQLRGTAQKLEAAQSAIVKVSESQVVNGHEHAVAALIEATPALREFKEVLSRTTGQDELKHLAERLTTLLPTTVKRGLRPSYLPLNEQVQSEPITGSGRAVVLNEGAKAAAQAVRRLTVVK